MTVSAQEEWIAYVTQLEIVAKRIRDAADGGQLVIALPGQTPHNPFTGVNGDIVCPTGSLPAGGLCGEL